HPLRDVPRLPAAARDHRGPRAGRALLRGGGDRGRPRHPARALLRVLVAHPAPAAVADEARRLHGIHVDPLAPADQPAGVRPALHLLRRAACQPAARGGGGGGVMPDNWGFVAAAYGLTAAVLLIYWRRLAKKEREVDALKRPSPRNPAPRSVAASSPRRGPHASPRALRPGQALGGVQGAARHEPGGREGAEAPALREREVIPELGAGALAVALALAVYGAAAAAVGGRTGRTSLVESAQHAALGAFVL